jgi:hypothetical protein
MASPNRPYDLMLNDGVVVRLGADFNLLTNLKKFAAPNTPYQRVNFTLTIHGLVWPYFLR